MGGYWAGVTGIDTGAAKKTLLQMVAGTLRNGLYEVTITFKGVSSVGVPILATLERQTDAGTGGVALATNWGPSRTDTAMPTSGTTFQAGPTSGAWTAEPAAGSVIAAFDVHPQSGIVYQIPLGDEIVIPASGRLGLCVTAAAAVTATATMRWREGV